MREYETIIILNPDLTTGEVNRVSARVKDILEAQDATLLKVEIWGKRKLAYKINKKYKGIFVYYLYLGLTSAVDEFERNMKMMENCLKFQTVKLAEDVDLDSRTIDESALVDFLAAAEAVPEKPEESTVLEAPSMPMEEAPAEAAPAPAEEAPAEAAPAPAEETPAEAAPAPAEEAPAEAAPAPAEEAPAEAAPAPAEEAPAEAAPAPAEKASVKAPEDTPPPAEVKAELDGDKPDEQPTTK